MGINKAAKGARKERERIEYYTAHGWKLLSRAVRTKFQREDLGGAWDMWFARFRTGGDNGVEWLFVQVGSWRHRAKKLHDCKEWVATFGLRKGCRYVVDTYNVGNVWRTDEC